MYISENVQAALDSSYCIERRETTHLKLPSYEVKTASSSSVKAFAANISLRR
jgi:hypothetical protein